jgi:pimeloyl-ACP methyl ester carboxylesterase
MAQAPRRAPWSALNGTHWQPIMTHPSFLVRLPESAEAASETDEPLDCIFEHRAPLGTSRVYWWPPTKELSGSSLDTFLLFVPGNPGLAAFYLPFLSAIHSAKSDRSLAILAHTHAGYAGDSNASWPADEQIGLVAQVAALVEVIDAVRAEYGSDVNIVVGGHSMGSWLATQVLKQRPADIASLLLLFPTICNIADTPNGVLLRVSFPPGSTYHYLILFSGYSARPRRSYWPVSLA